MSGWVEVRVRGECRAFLDASHIKGALIHGGLGGDELATPEAPIALIMASGETLEGVYGISVTRLLFRIQAIRQYLRATGKQHIVIYLDSAEAFDAEMAVAMEGGGRGEGS